jgi:hypothetical protein
MSLHRKNISTVHYKVFTRVSTVFGDVSAHFGGDLTNSLQAPLLREKPGGFFQRVAGQSRGFCMGADIVRRFATSAGRLKGPRLQSKTRTPNDFPAPAVKKELG